VSVALGSGGVRHLGQGISWRDWWLSDSPSTRPATPSSPC
jgi:hypothetical protein